VRHWGLRGNILWTLARAQDGAPVHESPDVRVKAAELALNRQERLRVRHRTCNFEPVPDDPWVLEQPFNLCGGEAGDLFRVKAGERRAVFFATLEDRLPAEPRLGALENHELK